MTPEFQLSLDGAIALGPIVKELMGSFHVKREETCTTLILLSFSYLCDARVRKMFKSKTI